jgi:hypothetical protein
MEIYRNDTASVKLAVPVTPVNGTFMVKAYEGSTLLHEFPTVTAVTGGYQVTLPFSLVDTDSEFVIKWQFDYLEGAQTRTYTSQTPVKVVTPYATTEEILEAIPEASGFSTSELVRTERRIRGIIDGYTGQKFGRFEGTRQVIGAGEQQLSLPDRLVSLTDISGSGILDVPDFYTVRGDGYYVGVSNPTPDGDYVFENVIRDPDSMWNGAGFKDNIVYTITGVWGYDVVPSDVKEAALLLIEEQLCPQSVYRDRYLKAISGDGWRYEFVGQAYEGTGSVLADQLLDPYRRLSMTVI